jgi:yersiniabactin nonribosomal peptide synthetase
MPNLPTDQLSNILTKAAVQESILALIPDFKAVDAAANLIELGLDSMQMMRLVNQWRKCGAKVTFAELIEQPTLASWYEKLLVDVESNQSKPSGEVVQNLAQVLDGKPFPLTDVQYAYWFGRDDNQDLGGVGCHAYIELDGINVSPEKLEKSWHVLLKQHSMLRARFNQDGQQVIHPEASKPQLVTHDFTMLLEKDVEKQTLKIRNRLSHRKLDVTNGQVLSLELSKLPNNKTRIHFDIDLLVADVHSLHIILRDLASAYRNPQVNKTIANWRFGDYLAIEASRNVKELEEDKNYWIGRLSELPAGPQIPLIKDPSTINKPKFTRRTQLINTSTWQSIKRQAALQKVTPAMVLVTAYAETLSRWSSEQKFVLNIPLFDRKTDHKDIENVVADFTNLLLLECDCQEPKNFSARARQIQAQFHVDVAHSSFSAVNIQRELVKKGISKGVSAPVVFACNLGTEIVTEECKQTLGSFSYSELPIG